MSGLLLAHRRLKKGSTAMARNVYNGCMKTNASVSAHSDSNPNVENLDRLDSFEATLRRMAYDHAKMASEHASMAKELAALRSNRNAHHDGNGSSVLEAAEATALTDRRGMMKKMAGLAVGVAAVGLLRPTKSIAGDPSEPDATGDNFKLGQFNAANQGTGVKTTLENAGTVLSNSTLVVDNVGFGSFTAPGSTSIAVVGHTDTAGGTPVNNAAIGVYGSGVSAGTGDATGVFGTGSDYGVRGKGAGADAVGTYGEADIGAGAMGVAGASTTGVGGAFSGRRAALELVPGLGAVADPNVTSPGGASGDIYRGSTNTSLWYKASTGYRRLADSTTAGALTVFAASSRFINHDPLGAGLTHAYQIGGVTVTGNTVPAKARAIIGRISDFNPTGGGGALLVSATNPPPAGTGVIPVNAGAPLNSFFVCALDATGKLYVKNSSPSGSTEVLIDIGGYYE